MKLKPRKITLDEFESENQIDEKARKKREAKDKKYTPKHPMTRVHNRESELRQEQRKTKPHKFCPTCGDKMPIETRRRVEEKEKTDYFVEEIRANIIYHNKIFPLVGMIAGSVARGVGAGAKKVGGELLDGMGDMAKEQSKESEDEK